MVKKAYLRALLILFLMVPISLMSLCAWCLDSTPRVYANIGMDGLIYKAYHQKWGRVAVGDEEAFLKSLMNVSQDISVTRVKPFGGELYEARTGSIQTKDGLILSEVDIIYRRDRYYSISFRLFQGSWLPKFVAEKDVGPFPNILLGAEPNPYTTYYTSNKRVTIDVSHIGSKECVALMQVHLK